MPRLPSKVDVGEVLPWLGFALSGAAGMTWYSYWLCAERYGAADTTEEQLDPGTLSDDDRWRLRGWIRRLTLDNSVAVAGTLVIVLAFLILGAELLRPERIVPEEDHVARVLGELLGKVWGRVGFWVMVGGVLVAFWSSVLSSQDGFARLFSAGTPLLLGARRPASRWRDSRFLRRFYLIVLLTALPLALYLIADKPVVLLAVAGGSRRRSCPCWRDSPSTSTAESSRPGCGPRSSRRSAPPPRRCSSRPSRSPTWSVRCSVDHQATPCVRLVGDIAGVKAQHWRSPADDVAVKYRPDPPTTQLVHVGRQPIWNIDRELIGYELLFRSGPTRPPTRTGRTPPAR